MAEPTVKYQCPLYINKSEGKKDTTQPFNAAAAADTLPEFIIPSVQRLVEGSGVYFYVLKNMYNYYTNSYYYTYFFEGLIVTIFKKKKKKL